MGNGPKSKRKYTVINPGIYNKLLEAFREKPGGFANAARVIGSTPEMTKRGWEKGWPEKGEWAEPIRVVIEREQTIARARIQQEGEAMRAEQHDSGVISAVDIERSRQQALEMRDSQAKLVRYATRGAIALNGAVAVMAPVALKISENLRDEWMAQLKAGTMGIEDQEKCLGKIKNLAATVVPIAETCIKSQNLHLGDPTEILAHGHVSEFDSMTVEELAEQIDGASATLAKASERGLVCLPGGKVANCD